jgi:hypothetical protein
MNYVGVSAQKTQSAICERLLERSRETANITNDLENLAKAVKKNSRISLFKKKLDLKEYAEKLLDLKNRTTILAFHFKRLASDNAENREALEKFLLAAKEHNIDRRILELESALMISEQNSAQIQMQSLTILQALQTILESLSAINAV